MDLIREVKIKYIDGNLEDGMINDIRGIILNESKETFTIGKIERKIIINKKFIIKVETVPKIRGFLPGFDI